MKKGLIFLLFVVVLLAGCSALYSKFKGPTQEKQLPRGIAINFIDGFPPNKIVEGQQFNVKTNIMNYSEYEMIYEYVSMYVRFHKWFTEFRLYKTKIWR